MNRLILGINKNGYIFKVTILPFNSWANYSYLENDFNFNIYFSAETIVKPSVLYKNLSYIGNITSKNNWIITLDNNCIVSNSKNALTIKNKS